MFTKGQTTNGDEIPERGLETVRGQERNRLRTYLSSFREDLVVEVRDTVNRTMRSLKKDLVHDVKIAIKETAKEEFSRMLQMLVSMRRVSTSIPPLTTSTTPTTTATTTTSTTSTVDTTSREKITFTRQYTTAPTPPPTTPTTTTATTTTTTTTATTTTTTSTTADVHREEAKTYKFEKQDCKTKPRPYPPVPRTCFHELARWYFNITAGRCEQFWGGCESKTFFPSRKNHFLSENTCKKSCVDPGYPAVCDLPYAQGLCHAKIKRWYYAGEKGCQEFEYSGCLGNRNRFTTKRMCHEKCGENQRPRTISLGEYRVNYYKITTMTPTTTTATSITSTATQGYKYGRTTKSTYYENYWKSTRTTTTSTSTWSWKTRTTSTEEPMSWISTQSYQPSRTSTTSTENPWSPLISKSTARRWSVFNDATERSGWKSEETAESGPNKIRHGQPKTKHRFSKSDNIKVKIYGPSVVKKGASFQIVCEVSGGKIPYRPEKVYWSAQDNEAMMYNSTPNLKMEKAKFSKLGNGVSKLLVTNYDKEVEFFCQIGCSGSDNGADFDVCVQDELHVSIRTSCKDEPSCNLIKSKFDCLKKGVAEKCCGTCTLTEGYIPERIRKKMRWNHGSGVINLKKKLEKYDILF